MIPSGGRIIFVVGNALQMESAVSVAKFLEPGVTFFLNLWSMGVGQGSTNFVGHTPPITPNRLWSLLASVKFEPTDVVVLPQDVGLLQQIIGKKAKARGSTLALMPDGIVSSRANVNGGPLRTWMRRALHAAFRRIRLLDGEPGRMGSSHPDYLLSWGSGWDDAFVSGAGTTTLHAGCPRMDDYAGLGEPTAARRLLVCSQPMFLPKWSQPYAGRWYEFLESLLDGSVEGVEIKVRLHPAEVEDARVPKRLRAAHAGEPLESDLAWAGCVAAPFSTVLVDALAAGRDFFVLSADQNFSENAAQIPLFADPRVRSSGWNSVSIRASLNEVAHLGALRSDYLANVGHSAETVAAALVGISSARGPDADVALIT